MTDQKKPLTDEEIGFGGDAAPAPKALGDTEIGFEPPARGFKGWAQDAAATAVKGAISVPEAIVGLADIPTGGRVGKFLENKDGAFGFRPDEAKAIANDWHSDATKEAQRKFQEADGIWDKTKTAVQNPSLIATTVGESLPSMIAGGAIGRGLLAATKYGAMAANAGRLSASEAAALKAAQISAGAAGEGATMAGSAAEQIRQQTDDRLLSPTQAAAAAGTGVMGGVVSRLSGGLANKLGIGEADTMLTQGARGVVNDVASAKSIPRQVIEGAVTEGLLEELPQSVGEQILQNLALNKNWAEGLDDAVVMGALSGGLMGSGAAGLHGFMAKGGAPALTPEQSPAQHRQPAPEQPLQLGNSPDPLIQFRDGTVARQSEIDAHLASLPERERQAFTAQILGYAPQQADERQMTTSPGATQFDGAATEQPSASVAAPDFDTSLGAQPEPQGGGLEFQRQIDTSGLSLERLDSPFAQSVPATALDRQALARQGAYPISPTPAPVLDTRRLSEQLGLSSNNGGLESAAAYAVDSGATPIAQALNSQPTGVVNGAQAQETQQAVAGQSQGAGAQERVAAAPKIRAVKLKDGTTAHVNEVDLTSGASQLRTFTADGKPRAARLQATHIAPAAPKVVLQNRNRATLASIAQMNAIAGKPDYLRTGASNTMDNGAPIVFGDLPQKVAIGRAQMVADGNGQRVPTQYAVVEAQDLITSNHADGSPVAEYANGVDGKLRAVAGNGRAAGLKAAWQRGTAGQYGQELVQDAPNLGIAPEVLAQFEAPVLVRVMDAADVTPDMGDRSNVQAGLQMSAVEQASNDAQRLNSRDMEFDELGNPTAQTVMRFMQGMPVQERGNMLDSQGRATSQLLDRIRAAAFKQAYMSDSLVELAAQSADPEAKNILNGLAIVAGDMAQLAGAGDFDIRQAVTDAANMAVTAGRTGQSIAQYLQTRQIDENPETVVVMQFMAQNVRSAKRIADGLRAWAELAQSQIAIARQNAEQDTMFGDTPTLSRRELFERLNNDNLTEIEQQQLIEQQRRAELTKQGTQRPSTERAGNADGASDGAESRGTEPTNAQDAGREQADFALAQQTPEQIRAQEEAQAQAARDKAKEDAQAAEAERKAVERQEVTQRSEAAANDFQLGQSAEDNLSGQGDIFSSSPAQPESKPKSAKEALERVQAKKASEKNAAAVAKNVVAELVLSANEQAIKNTQDALTIQNTRSRLTAAYNKQLYRDNKKVEDYQTLRSELEELANSSQGERSRLAQEVLEVIDGAIGNLEMRKRWGAEQAQPKTATTTQKPTNVKEGFERVRAKKAAGEAERASKEFAPAPNGGQDANKPATDDVLFLAEGETTTTATGRQTTPFPKWRYSTGRVTEAHLKAVDVWLLDNARLEAQARGDDFNERNFAHVLKTPSNIPQADKDGAELYLFNRLHGQAVSQEPVKNEKPAARDYAESNTETEEAAKTPDRPAKWRSNSVQAAKVARDLGINIPKKANAVEIVRLIDAHDAGANGQEVEKAPAVVRKNTLFAVGAMPNTAEPVTVKDGVVFIGKYEALDFDSGEPVTVPKGSSREAVANALKDAGALSSKQRVFGLGNQAGDLAYSRKGSQSAIDKAYFAALERGDMTEAQRLVREAALENGYIDSEEFRDAHSAPARSVEREDFKNLDAIQKEVDDGYDSNLFAIAHGVHNLPVDFFNPEGLRYYSPHAPQSHHAARSAIANIKYGNNSLVKVYRAVPKGIRTGRLNNKDWVSLSRDYAVGHGKSRFGFGEYRIIEDEVKPEHLWFDGNDVNEWGFDNGEEYAQKNTKNNRKLLNTVTRDDDGNIIPLSKRFNQRTSDERFSRAPQSPRTPASTIRAAIEKAYGSLLSKLESKGLVQITQTEDDALKAAAKARAKVTGQSVDEVLASLRGGAGVDTHYSENGSIEGFFDPQTGKSFLVADNLSAESAAPTLMHEVGVHMANDGSLDAVHAQSASLLESSNGTHERRAKARLEEAGIKPTDKDYAEEATAYLVTEYEKSRLGASRGMARFMKDFVAAVRAWLYKHGYTQVVKADSLSASDIAAIARANAKSLANAPAQVQNTEAVRRSFAGAKAQTADTHALTIAQERLANGEDAEKVRQETGWSKGVDGKWRFEISDKDASYDADALKEMREIASNESRDFDPIEDSVSLDGVLEHPALFAAYPALKNIRVVFVDSSWRGLGGSRGAYAPTQNTIALANDLTDKQALSTLLHEIQHGIQHIEGFASGGSSSEVFIAVPELAKYRSLATKMAAEFRQPTQQERDEYESLFDKLLKQKLINKNGEFTTGRNVYMRLSGEVEARNTQARQNMTDAERRATAPSATADVADSDVIVTFNGKEMHNAPAPANATDPAQQFRETEQRIGGKPAYDKAKADGKTKLNYGQWVQVRTPAFKAWFGDWEGDPANASKVVDSETGEPLVVYHGSRFGGFSVFVRSAGGFIYTTPNADYASRFSGASDGSAVYPVYVSIKKPLDLTHLGERSMSAEEARVELKRLGVNLDEVQPWEGAPAESVKLYGDGPIWRLIREDRFSIAAKNAGFDGIKINEGDGETAWVAFESNQIKSATGNTGAFDSKNPDILLSRSPSTQAAQNTADSRASTAAQNPSNPSQVWAAIEGVFEGIDGLRQRLDAGTTVVRSAGELPQQFQQSAKDAQAQGFYDDKSKHIYLVADRIEAGQEKAVWLHEVFHKRGKELMGNTTVMARLHGAVQRWGVRKAGSVERQIYDAAHARAQADGNYNGEFLAYAIEEAVNRGVQPDLKTNITSAGYWLGKVMEAFRSALNKLTGRAATPKITADELVDIAYAAAGLEAQRNGLPTRLETTPQKELTLEEIGGGLENIVRETEIGKRIINADVEAQLRRIMNREQFREDGYFGARTDRKLEEIIKSTRVKVGETVQEQERSYLQAAMKLWAHVIFDVHKNAHMRYHAMPIGQFNQEDNPIIYKSKSYNGRQSSEYRLVLVDGKPAFARKSNHWGTFTTNIYEGSEDAKRLGLKNDTGDQFGRVGWKSHNWELEGGNVDARNSQAGYVLLEDLVKAAGKQDNAAKTQAQAKELEAQKATELPLQFSRAKMQSIKESALNQVSAVMSHPGKVSLWDKTVGTMRHLAEREPAFKPVFDTAQGFIDDVAMLASDAADVAPRILPRVEGFGDIFGKSRKKTISAEDSKAVAAPIFQGTLNWGRDVDGKPALVSDLKEKYADSSADDMAQMMLKAGQLDPEVLKMWQGMKVEQYEKAISSRFENTFLKGGVVWQDAELVEHFKATPEQISLYREARATIDRSIDMTARADMLRFLGEEYENLREMVLDAPSLDQASVFLLDTLEEDAKADFDSRDRLADLMQGVRQRQEKANDLMKAGYAPLSRFGRYTVDVVDANGKREYFGMFESMKESNAMFADMKKAFPNAEVKQGTISQEEFKLFAGVTPESLELFGNMLGLEGDGNEARDKAFQKYLQLTKNNHSALKRLIHRQGIAGYSEDVGRVLASFVYSNARQAAGGLSAGKMERAIAGIPKGKGELRDVAMGLRDYIQDPQEEGQAIRGMLFAQYLGGSVASAMVNMTQPFAVTMPYLSQFGGMAQSGAHLAKALKDMATKGFKYETDLGNAMKQAEDDGVVSPQEIHQLMGQARGAGGLRVGDGTKVGNAKATASNNWEKLKVLWGQPFALAEQFNRRSTFIAAFRIAKEQGMANPAEFARKAVLETQFLFSKANKPKWARGAIGGTLFTFKSYSVSYLELLQRTWNPQKQDGESVVAFNERRAAGRRAVAWSMAMLMMMGGAGGLPFMEDLEDLIDGIAQLMGFNFSAKQQRQELLREILGKEFADFMENGVSGMPGAPIDVSGRLGMGNLIPGTGLLMTKQNRERDLLEVLGPAGDLVSRGFKGARKALTGDIAGAALEVSPTAVRNAVKGADMASSGMYKDAKGYKVIDTTLDEAIAKAAGFQPRSVAEVQEANGFMMRSKSFYTQTSSDIKAQWADAVFRKDEAALNRVRERLASWNRDNPDQPIVVKIPDIMKKVREMGKDRTQRIADTAPKALRAQMREMAAGA